MVVAWHFMLGFFPAVIHGWSAHLHNPFEISIYQTPLSVLVAGNFAVTLFFMLSGFVLTYRYMAGEQKTLFPAAAKRYFRLMPLVAVSILGAYVVMKFGAITGGAAGHATGSDWLPTYFTFNPNFFNAVWEAGIGAFMKPVDAQSYNPLLWTIYYELVGSLVVFGLASLLRGHSKRWLVYIVAIVITSSTSYVGFIVGLALADAYANRRVWFGRVSSAPFTYKFLALATALGMAGYPAGRGNTADYGAYYNAITLFPQNIPLTRITLQLIAAAIIIVLALSWRRFGRVLEVKPLVWLGKISYSLYICHYIIIFSLTSGLFLWFVTFMDYSAAAFTAMAASFACMLFIAALLQQFVEEPSIRLAGRIGEWSKK